MSEHLSNDDLVNMGLALDFEQRQRASALADSVGTDEVAAAYEIIYLRDAVTEMTAALKAAEKDLSTFEREIRGVAPEAKSPALPLIRKALAKKVPRD